MLRKSGEAVHVRDEVDDEDDDEDTEEGRTDRL
jgi:hypothetical protein